MESVLLCTGLVDIQLTQTDSHGDCLSIPLCRCAASAHFIKLPANVKKRLNKRRQVCPVVEPERKLGCLEIPAVPETSVGRLKEDFLTGICTPWTRPDPDLMADPRQGGGRTPPPPHASGRVTVVNLGHRLDPDNDP